MRYLGLDLGSKTLGLAISDKLGMIASSLKTIRFEEEKIEDSLEELGKIVLENEIEAFVLGLPKNMNNTMSKSSDRVMKYTKILEEKFQLPVYFQDERLTSMEANNILIKSDMSRKKRKQTVDKIAATIILQGYLDRSK